MTAPPFNVNRRCVYKLSIKTNQKQNLCVRNVIKTENYYEHDYKLNQMTRETGSTEKFDTVKRNNLVGISFLLIRTLETFSIAFDFSVLNLDFFFVVS